LSECGSRKGPESAKEESRLELVCSAKKGAGREEENNGYNTKLVHTIVRKCNNMGNLPTYYFL
jgi:hypothetical protein